MDHPELNINFDPRDVASIMAANRRGDAHECSFDGRLGRMTYDHARVIARVLSDTAEPLMKWVAVNHAMERGASSDEIMRQFPWLDITDETDDDEDEDIDIDEDEDDDDEDIDIDDEDDDEDDALEDGEIGPTSHPEIPRDITDTIYRTWGMTPIQIDTVMQLISLPENGSTQWPLFYNYIEYGDDHAVRGYTTTIFGATSGTGSLLRVFQHLREIDPDHPLVVTYMDAMERAKGGDITGLEGLAHVDGDPTRAKADYSKWEANGRAHLDHIQGDLATLEVDDRWRQAVWRAFLELNWESAAHFCYKTGPCADRPGPYLSTALAQGFIVDTSLNHGDCRWWNDAKTWTRIWDLMESHPEDERAWLKKFMKARKAVLKSGFQGLDWSKSGDRVELWRTLLRDGNMNLDRPIRVADSTHTPPIWPSGLEIL